MPLIVWSDDFRFGIEEIDTQHQQLFSLINELHDAMAHGKGKSITAEVLDALVSYTVKHFSTEELLMQAHRYAGLWEHRASHQKFTATVVQFQKAYKDGSATLNIDIMEFLRQWLVTHIQGTDRKYVPILKDASAN
ncbi:MAG: bacteriohemerythrin [Candidatus Korobacteraceae bacterium]